MAGKPEERIVESHAPAPAQPGKPGMPGAPQHPLAGELPESADAADWEAELAALSEDEAADEYSHLIEDYSHLAPPSDGEVIEGRVLSVSDKGVIVDIG